MPFVSVPENGEQMLYKTTSVRQITDAHYNLYRTPIKGDNHAGNKARIISSFY